MTLSDQLTEIIRQKYNSLPMDELGGVFVEKTKTDTLRGVDPTGSEYPAYEKDTASRKGSSTVTMRDHGFSMESLFSDTVAFNEAKLSFSGLAGKEGTKSRKPGGEVFLMHQEGSASGGKVRKVFPEPEDENSQGVQAAISEFENIIEQHFNG